MKIKLTILTVIMNIITASGQTPVIDIRNQNGSPLTGAYYKDVNNLLDTYQGSYIYTNGTISFKVVLTKKVQQYNGRYYEDLIIGEYEYSVDNIILISTLSNINVNYNNQSRHDISGNLIIKKLSKPICDECGENELRLRLSFMDKTRELYGSMTTRKIIYYNHEAIKVILRRESTIIYYEGDPVPPDDFIVPSGEYIMIKQ